MKASIVTNTIVVRNKIDFDHGLNYLLSMLNTNNESKLKVSKDNRTFRLNSYRSYITIREYLQ